MKINFFKLELNKYKNLAIQEINNDLLTGVGQYISKTEKLLAELNNVKYCLLTSSGTSATECLLIALKFKYHHIKKIYIPNNTFISAWSAAIRVYGSKYVEAIQCDPDTYNLKVDQKSIEGLEQDSAFLCIHNIGSIVNIPEFHRIRPDIIIIEDNCEGFMGKYNGIKTGSFKNTLASSISFYANKLISCGEGGAFLTNDEEIYNHIKMIRSHGSSKETYIHPIAGNNFRITNVQAAFLFEQVLDIENIIKNKKRVYQSYRELLFQLEPEVKCIKTVKNTESSYWVNAINISKVNEIFSKILDKPTPVLSILGKGSKNFEKLNPSDLF